MCPVIRVSDKLYERLGKHASGFEAPSKVIERLLEAYEATNKSDAEASSISRSPSEPTNTLDLLELSFKSFFNVHPRPFGQKNSGKKGFSDDNNGVQWNVCVDQDTGAASLGVNLEGMKYKDWPIANLLIREKSELTLPSLSTTTESEEIYVGLYRDAWQAAARLPIKERNIVGSDTPLSEIDNELWIDMIDEALLCLNADKNYKGRKTEEVTLIKTGKVVIKEITPHLNIYTKLWSSPPVSIEEVNSMLETAYERLLPVYDLVNAQTL